MGEAKPPLAVKVKGLGSFTRLALSLTDFPPLLWHFKLQRKHYLGVFSVYMFWRGDIPLFAYIPLDEPPNAFLAYRSDGEREEAFFTDNVDDTKYVYGPVIDVKNPPKIFVNSIRDKWPRPPKPLTVELENVHSLIRLLNLVSLKEYTVFPVWHFQREEKRILGVCIPFEHYYESNALPVFFYVPMEKPPEAPFLRYATSKATGETLEYSRNTGETKYFYAKIIDVEDMPLFP